MFSVSPLTECYRHVDSDYGTSGYHFWVAGQRIDPSSRSQFVWRETSTDTYDTIHAMTFTNWLYSRPDDDYGMWRACVYMGANDAYSDYRWHAAGCHEALCSLCELDV